MRQQLVIGVGVVGLLATACSSDGPSINSFDVPSSANCPGGETGTVAVNWDTTDATEVLLLVDGAQAASVADASGSETLDVPCDGEDHNIGLTARGDDSKSSSDTKSVSTEADSGGGDTTAPGGGDGGTTTPGGGTTPTTGGGSTTTTSATTTTPNNPTTTSGTPATPPANVPAPDPGPASQ